MEHIGRMQAAVDFIEHSLKEDLTLEDIARKADMSPYHFHRMFHALVGEPVGTYVRRRRLTLASRELIETDRRIIDIAFDYLFESQESFSRSFKKMFGTSPGKFRLSRKRLTLIERRKLTAAIIVHRKGGMSMKPRFVHNAAFTVAGLRCTTTINTNQIPELWGQFMPRAGEIKNALPGASYGICENNGVWNIADFNRDTEFHEVVGLAVSSADNLPSGMVSRVVKESDYAVFTHRGKLNTLRDTYDYIYGVWFPQS
ncbi:MAG TPA: helix-turn-helix domain-containing protein, partial [Spirochaetota bacterium]